MSHLRLVLLTTVLLAFVSPVEAEQIRDEEFSITVDFLVDTRYDDSVESLQHIQSFFDLRIFEYATANTFAELREYLFQRYEFGPSELPQTFGLITSEIMQANLTRKDLNTWRIPALPRRRKTELNPDNPHYDLPRVAEFQVMHIWPHGIDIRQDSPTHEEQRIGAWRTLIHVTLPRTYYLDHRHRFEKSPLFRGISREYAVARIPVPQADLPEGLLREQTRPLSIESQRSPAAISGQTPAPEEDIREFIPSLEEHTRHSYLIVIDDGWPSAETQEDALAFLERAINSIRAHFRLPSINLTITEPHLFAKHASRISASIEAFEQSDVDDAVRVLFFPAELSASNEAMFRELLLISYLLEHRPQRSLSKSIDLKPLVPAATAFVDEAIHLWKASIEHVDQVAEFRVGAHALNAMYSVIDLIARNENTVFVVNQSWTINGDLLSFAPTGRSFTVAAAGNERADFLKSRVDFAQRSASDSKVLAVINVNHAGILARDSNMVPPDRALEVNLLGYDGCLPDGQCGTSFAAPRVAWLLAARLTTIDSPFDQLWQQRLQHLARLARIGGNAWKHVTLEPSKLWD